VLGDGDERIAEQAILPQQSTWYFPAVSLSLSLSLSLSRGRWEGYNAQRKREREGREKGGRKGAGEDDILLRLFVGTGMFYSLMFFLAALASAFT
jgi:hypothetical protein